MSRISKFIKGAFSSEEAKTASRKPSSKERAQIEKDVEKAVLDAWDTAKALLEPFADKVHYDDEECDDEEWSGSDIAKNKTDGSKYEWKSEAQYRAEPKKEAVNHPSHYQGKKFEVIDIIDDYGLGFNLGNALKYLLRAGHKDDYCQDLRKAVWYLNREIDTAENSKADSAIPKGL